MTAPPRIVLSLDFELRWGLYDVLGDDVEAYRAPLEGVREVVPRMLELFEQRGVRATWATVAAMALSGWDEHRETAPTPPSYRDPALRLDARRLARLDPSGRLHFAPELVRAVAGAPGQELGCHTFHHIYSREAGVTPGDAAADARAARRALERFAPTPTRSFVFPRNQVGFLDELRDAGVEVFRSPLPVWFWTRTAAREESILVRGLRLADTCFVARAPAPVRDAGMTSSAGTFLRINVPRALWARQVAAIAARASRLSAGEVLHLWLHPHNLGGAPRRSLARLRQLLERIEGAAPAPARWATLGELATPPPSAR